MKHINKLIAAGALALAPVVVAATSAQAWTPIKNFCPGSSGAGWWVETYLFNDTLPPPYGQLIWCGPYASKGAAQEIGSEAQATYVGTGTPWPGAGYFCLKC